MKRTWTVIGVADVHRSVRWYQTLLGLPETAPAHDYFGQILDSDGTVLLCLHEWGAHDHPSLTSPQHAEPGNGLLLFFRVDNFDVALARARSLATRLDEEPHVNPNTGTEEFSVRDPDGYYVTVSALPTPGGNHRQQENRVLIPPGFNSVTPYFFAQDAAGFVEFLKAGLGGAEVLRHMAGNRIANAQVRIGGTTVMISEATDSFPPMPGSYYLYVENADESMSRALAAGATKVMEVADMPYDDRQGGIRDPWGNLWWISQRLVDGPY